MSRRVVLICGPPGAGKTTYAHTLGLKVYDVDDPHWTGEAEYRAAIAALANTPTAQAAVIRSGATATARHKAVQLCGATETIVLAVDPSTCADRVITRDRHHHHRELAAITAWWSKYSSDQSEATQPAQPAPRRTKTPRTHRSTSLRDRHRAAIKRTGAACHLCGEPIDYKLDHKNPRSFVADHVIPLDHHGPDTLANKAAAHRACNAAKGARLIAPIVRRSGTLD